MELTRSATLADMNASMPSNNFVHHTNSPPASSFLRNRRATTFAEGGHHASFQKSIQRRSSVLSNMSTASSRSEILPSQQRRSESVDLGASLSSVPRITTDEQEGSQWHGIALSFVIIPAVAGVFHKDVMQVMQDLMQVAMGGMFLYWCMRLPWYVFVTTTKHRGYANVDRDWYKSAQAMRIQEDEDAYEEAPDDVLYEEAEDEGNNDTNPARPAPTPHQPSSKNVEKLGEGTATEAEVLQSSSNPEANRNFVPLRSPEQEKALSGLRKTEMVALLACFTFPIIGAYLIHSVRAVLSSPSESLVNDINLSIFVLLAEARPFAQVCRIERTRIDRLQRAASPSCRPAGINNAMQTLESRIAHLEDRFSPYQDILDSEHSDSGSSYPNKPPPETIAELTTSVRQTLQPQLDALNRAVRRYEKRTVTQTIQTEARIRDLEDRLADALSLAAIAARNMQRPGLVQRTLESVASLIAWWMSVIWHIAVYPFVLFGKGVKTFKELILGSNKKRKEVVRGRDGTMGISRRKEKVRGIAEVR
jgi:hypothetical protein